MFHSMLLLGYGSLVTLKLMSKNSTKTLAAISVTTIGSIVLSAVVALLTCSPEWVKNPIAQTSLSSSLSTNLLHPKGVSFSKWISPASACGELSLYDNETTTYRSSLPPIGPGSRDDSFMNPFTRFIMSGFNDDEPTRLKAVFFSVPDQYRRNNDRRPGLVIFIHGGGWWTGDPRASPGPCHAEFAFSQGWSYAHIDYRLLRNGWSGDVQLQDVKDGIGHLLDTYATVVDLRKVVVIGSSAGANLGLTASYQLNNEKANLTHPIIAGVLVVAPSTSVTIGTGPNSIPRWAGAWNERAATERFCEGVFDCNKRLSPLEHVTKYTPQTVIIHGVSDEWYAVHHSRALAKKLARNNIPYVYLEPPLMPHCIDLAQNSIPYQMGSSAFKELMQSL